MCWVGRKWICVWPTLRLQLAKSFTAKGRKENLLSAPSLFCCDDKSIPMTDIEKVRTLIGDPAGADQTFSDAEIQLFLDLSNGSLLLATALACERLAIVAAGTAQQTKLGDYTVSFKNSDVSFQTQADRFRDLEYNTPAFAIIEENLSSFNELTIIRNYVLRTEP